MKPAWALSALVALSACGELAALLPPAPDGGHLTVPGTFHDARISPGHRIHLELTGDKQLACHDCHFITDAGFRGDAVKPCVSCHEAQQEHHHPFDGGVPMTCFSCHAFRTATQAQRVDKWGCRRCHVEPQPDGGWLGPLVGAPNPDGLPPHVTVHVAKCENCHRPHGVPFTKAADCGKCHDVVASHGRGEKALPADTCMTCHPHHSKAATAGTLCLGCHQSEQVPPAARVKAGALFSPGHVACSSCHKPHQFVAAKVAPCITCHVGKPVLAAQKHGSCVTCHSPHSERAEPKPCQSCHAKLKVEHPPDAQGHTCTGCHRVHSAELAASTPPALAVPCITCHKDAPFTAATVHAQTVACSSCHLVAHRGKPQRDGLCVQCHATQVNLVRKNPGHRDCAKCHAGLPHGEPVAPKACLECHPDHQPPQKGHVRCDSCHQSHSATVVKTCTQCHDPLPPGLHSVKQHQTCRNCHAPHGPAAGLSPKTCLGCHPTPPVKFHPTPPQQCISCHLFRAPR